MPGYDDHGGDAGADGDEEEGGEGDGEVEAAPAAIPGDGTLVVRLNLVEVVVDAVVFLGVDRW